MPQSNATRLQSLFSATLELPEADREPFMELQCQNDPAMLSELRALLEMDENLANKTIRPIAPELSKMLSASAPAESMVGLRVGAFELREELGRGGMGSVYRAERVDGSVAQQAAIKFVRRELLDANTLRRFQIERQTLAALDHPNIARLLDAGELDDGTPYFVMEYVAGVPITDYCTQAKLGVRERVQLFRLVCAAVMQAHRSLVVHRDLKPSNILVSAEGAPKLLDFGIAKPLNADFNSTAEEQTGTAQRYFSPSYSAPEQLLGGAIGVGCDVYALGLLLYELLAGTRPFDFTGLTAGQIERLVTTVPPDAPSIAASKIESTQALQRQLRGDLDGVVLRCLRKAANERYASVEQLDADLGNYLEGRPVLARGGHGWYRARKFVLRNKFAVGASIFIAAMLTTGIAIIARQSKIARLQAQIAEQRAAELEKVVKFQVGMLAQVDPGIAGQSLSNDVHAMLQKALDRAGASEAERSELTSSFSKAWESISTTDAARNLIDTTVLKPATAEIDRQFSGQPLVDAALRQSLADLYRHLGLLDAAFPLQKQALKVRRQMLLPGTPELSDSLSSMGLLLHERGDLVAAEEHLREALQERRSSLGNNNPNTLDSAHQLGEVLVSQGKQSDAESLFREALEGRRHILGETHPETLTSMIRLGAIYMDVGRPADAEPYVREAYEKASSSLEENHQFRIFAAFRMGALMRLLGRLPEAEVFAREATERRRKLLGQDHQDTMRSTDLLSIVLQEQGKLAEAEPFSLAVLNTRRKILGEEHLDTASATINMASLLRRQNKLAEAEPLFRKASAIFSPKPGTDPFFTNVSIYKLGDVLQAQGKHAEAITILAPAEDQMREVFTGNHASRLATFLMALGRARTGLKQFAIAESNLLESNTIYGLTPGPYPKDRRDSVQALVELYGAWHAKEPDKGYDVLASKWKKELEETQSTDP